MSPPPIRAFPSSPPAALLVINRVGKIADFGHKQGKGFGKRAAHPYPIFMRVPPPPPPGGQCSPFRATGYLKRLERAMSWKLREVKACLALYHHCRLFT